MNPKTNSFRDLWMWQEPLLSRIVWIFIVVPVLVGCALFPFFGASALFVFPLSAIGLGFWLVYGGVGKRVRKLSRSIPVAEGETVEGLIVNGYIQSPGVIAFKGSEIELAPIVGDATSIPLSAIASVRECHWFNGSYYLWKTGFWLTVSERDRLGFAVATGAAGRCRDLLRKLDR